jgi:hypothetical protein
MDLIRKWVLLPYSNTSIVCLVEYKVKFIQDKNENETFYSKLAQTPQFANFNGEVLKPIHVGLPTCVTWSPHTQGFTHSTMRIKKINFQINAQN